VASAPGSPEAFRRRLVGLYALTLMDRDGPLHGYGLSDRIAVRTGGTWRPGPGSVYPSLRRLVDHGLACPRPHGRRRVYTITAAGRRFLQEFRGRRGALGGHRPDLSPLWAEVLGVTDTGRFLLDRLDRTLAALEDEATRSSRAPAEARRLAREVRATLAAAAARWRPAGRRGLAGRAA
jgi:DNA-binding PadR family transcriptional regulator